MSDQKKKRVLMPLFREALLAMSLGWDLAIPIFGGVIIGYFLDRWLDSSPTFTLGLLLVGIGVGYYNVVRFIRKVTIKKRQQQQQEDDNSAEGEEEKQD